MANHRKNGTHRNPGEDDDQDDLDLESLDGSFASAPRASRTVPDGDYHARIDRVELATARASHRPLVKWTLRITGPTHQNRLLWKKSVLASHEGMSWLKHDLHLCGLELEKLSDLPECLDRLVGLVLKVSKKTKGDWTNVHFNRRLLPEEIEAPEPF